MKKPKKQKKVWFIQSWGTYTNETLVVVGYSHKQLIALIKRLKIRKDTRQRFLDESESIKELMAGKCDGLVWEKEGTTLLWLDHWDSKEWASIETLLHESVHLVHMVFKEHKHMWDELEAVAYQIEFLFRSMRRKLTKLYESPKVS